MWRPRVFTRPVTTTRLKRLHLFLVVIETLPRRFQLESVETPVLLPLHLRPEARHAKVVRVDASHLRVTPGAAWELTKRSATQQVDTQACRDPVNRPAVPLATSGRRDLRILEVRQGDRYRLAAFCLGQTFQNRTAALVVEDLLQLPFLVTDRPVMAGQPVLHDHPFPYYSACVTFPLQIRCIPLFTEDSP